MPLSYVFLAVLAAYLLGSIPTAVWVGKFFYGIDIREHGSGNAGATNTFRVLGVRAGVPVLMFDILKGYLAVSLIRFLDHHFLPGTAQHINMKLILGVASVVGHVFPAFAGFKGGKGVATLAGVTMALHPMAALVSVGVFAVMLVTTRYVSLSSMAAGFSFPLVLIGVFKVTAIALVVFALLIAIMLLFTHQPNIERLIRRQESKANLFRRRRKKTL